MSRWDKFVDSVDEYTRPISNSMVYRSIVASDICTAYKPFEIFKSYFANYTTGLSLAYLIVSVAFIIAYMEILWARSVYGDNQRRSDSFRGSRTYEVAIPTLTGVAMNAPNYPGETYWEISLSICEEDASGITTLESNCETKNLVPCTNYVAQYGLSQAANKTLNDLDFMCPEETVYIANNAENLRNQKYMTILITVKGTEFGIYELLESGAEIYWMGANFMPDENKLPDEKFVVHVFSVITSASAGHYRFAQRYRFWEAKLSALSYYDPFETVHEDWLVFESSNLGFTGLEVARDPVTEGHYFAVIANFQHTPLPLASSSAIKYYGPSDYATLMAGLIGFLFILVGSVVKLYNRWSYRGDGHCGVCKGGCGDESSQTCFKGQSHGGIPFASKIAWKPYMESIFSRELTLDPVGHTLLRDKLDSYGSEYDLWKQVSDLTEECHAAKMRLKKTLHTSAMLEDL